MFSHLLDSPDDVNKGSPYGGESTGVRWTVGELNAAFEGELRWEPLESTAMQPFTVNVPPNLRAAVAKGFKVEIQSSRDYESACVGNSTERFMSVLSKAFAGDNFLAFGP